MRSAALVAAVLLSMASLGGGGCKPQAAVTATSTSSEKISSTITALGAGGIHCETSKGNKLVLVCEQDEPKVKFVLGVDDMPPRMLIVMTFTYETNCDPGRLKRLNLFHSRVDFANAYCEEKRLTFVGSHLIPEYGLTAKELSTWAHWWTKATLQAGSAAGLFEDEGASSKEEHGDKNEKGKL